MGDVTKTYADLPSDVADYLLSEEVFDRYPAIAQTFHLPDGSDAEIGRLTDGVVLGEWSLASFPTVLADQLKIDPATATNLARELAGKVLLPIAKNVGDVSGAIVKWGGNPQVYGASTHTSSVGGIQIQDPILAHRLSLIADSYNKGVRSAADTKEVLMRDTKVGGMEFSEDEADRVLKSMESNRASLVAKPFEPAKPVSVVKAPEPKPVLPLKPTTPQKPAPLPPKPSALPTKPSVPKPKPPAPSAQSPAPRVWSGKIDLEALKQTVAKIKTGSKPSVPRKFSTNSSGELLAPEEKKELQAMEQKAKTIHAAHPPLLDMKAAVKEMVKDAGVTLADEEMKKRFERIADARLRDVRDAYETRAQLENPLEQGGLGLTGRPLVDAMEVIERVVQEFERDLSASVARDKASMITARQEKKKVETASGVKIDLEKLKQTIANVAPATRPAPARFSPASIPTTPVGKPKVEDVRFTRTLSGPVEEIGALTLGDFRRLSKDPKQAATKLLDKVGLVEQQGYDKKIAAIKAWRSSPINQLYMTLTREAIQTGKSVTAVLEEKRKGGAEMFTTEELNTVLSLNAALRF